MKLFNRCMGFIIIICLLMSVVLISGCITDRIILPGSHTHTKVTNSLTVSPQGTFDTYITALNKKDAETIYNLLMEGTKEKTLRSEFYNNFDFSKTDKGQYVDYDNFDYTMDDLSAVVTADMTYRKYGGFNQDENLYSTEKMSVLMYWENGGWKIII
ncbi:hypothetical protein [Methanoplanus endosymbiosus]|uniref:DUF4829 domain-containing protein n=1 Tax=Methanoplanus endosymbiosus TaxID=33865 RepID=A0A9E7PKY8_9EURY|nr:hypothetical protein [Methanoplanus endosymbiosus]UUX92074.1 hypothetical protein L6E24_12025 [Methanoplanus endosymbiosus]